MEASPEGSPRSELRRAGIALAALAAIIVLALLFVFDGEDELSRDEFVERGDEICREAHAEFEELQADRPQTASQAAELTARLIDISRQELEDLNGLGAPSELDEPLATYLDAREEGIEELERGFEAAEDKDAFAYATAQAKVASGQLKRLRLARAVGFEECSRPLVSEAELRRQSQPPG